MFADAKPGQGRFTPLKARLVRKQGTVNHEPERFAAAAERFIAGEGNHLGGDSRGPKRNGADLAVDPTLTGVWASEEALDAWRLDAGSEKLLRALKVGF